MKTMTMKTMTWEDYQKEKEQKLKEFNSLPFEKRLKKTVEKMISIVRGQTGGSKIYAQMMMSLLPNSDYEVALSEWLYKCDQDDGAMIFELMKRWNENNELSPKWLYEEFTKPYTEELKNYLKTCKGEL